MLSLLIVMSFMSKYLSMILLTPIVKSVSTVSLFVTSSAFYMLGLVIVIIIFPKAIYARREEITELLNYVGSFISDQIKNEDNRSNP